MIQFYNANDEKQTLLMDYIPLRPREPETLVNMILGRNVPGEVRIKLCKDATCNNRNIIDLDVNGFLSKAKALQKEYDKDMNLFSNNCMHFTDYAARYMIKD